MLKVGDKVMIRGDLRKDNHGKCVYLPEQLVDGKYVTNSTTGEAWVGIIEKIDGDEACVGGGWRASYMYERI